MHIGKILQGIGERLSHERRSLDQRFYVEGEQAMRKALEADRLLLEERSTMANSTGQLREYQRIVQQTEQRHSELITQYRFYTEEQGKGLLEGTTVVGAQVRAAAQREWREIEQQLKGYLAASAKLTEHLPKLREVLAITGVLRYQQLEDAAGEIQLFIPVAYAARQTPKTLMADLYDHAVVAFTNVESDGLNANDRADAESGLTVLVLSCERAQAIEALPALYRGLSAQPRRLKEARASVAVHYDSRPFPDTEALTVQVGKPMLDLEEIPRLLAGGYDVDRLQFEYKCPDNVHKIVAGYRAAETRRNMRPSTTATAPQSVTVSYASLDAVAEAFDTSLPTLHRMVGEGLHIQTNGSVHKEDLRAYLIKHPGRGRGNEKLKALREKPKAEKLLGCGTRGR